MTGGAKGDRKKSGAGKRSHSTNNNGSGGYKRPKHGGQRQHKSRHQQQPKRGGPGFLLTCEAGRESRCRGEGLDLIRHYYYHNLGGGDVVSNTQSTATSSCSGNGGEGGGADEASSAKARTTEAASAIATVADKKELSLEEEIALLQSGASADDVLFANNDGGKHDGKMDDDAAGGGRPERVGRKRAPFAIYDTGCKGTVIVLCTLPGCRLVNPETDADADDGAGSDRDGGGIGGKGDTSSTANDQSNDMKDTADANEDSKNISQNHKYDANPSAPTARSSPTWDPVEVMEQVINDMIATSSSVTGQKPAASEAARDAPSTRHVTRLVPLQATCFAATEDIIKTAKPLLEKHFISQVKRRQLGANDSNNKIKGAEEEKARPITFEIVFKRRFNSKVRRDPLIDALAKLIAELRKSHDVDDGALAVDLKNPDYSIQIEVIQNICGISVIPGGRSYRKFNLVELMESGRRVGSDGNVASDDNNQE